ncbi:MAG: hypothetical protein E7384_02820 [Ruminococcaceae bacterium]|nr:hypothetical protein [Oscillospiraceae bacterium]
MEELIHIPYGACIISADGTVKDRIDFLSSDIHNSFGEFYETFSSSKDTEVTYLYFITVDADNIPSFSLDSIFDIYKASKNPKLLGSFYAQYGIYAYSVSKHTPIYSYRIKHLSKNPSKLFTVMQTLYNNAVAPSHITEVLESINEKTPA